MRFRLPVRLALGAGMLIVAGFLVGPPLIQQVGDIASETTRALRERVAWATALAEDVRVTLGVRPRTVVEDQIVHDSTTGILELATVQQRLSYRYVWTHTLLGSTKELDLEGVFVIKAGFNLSQGFEMRTWQGEPPLVVFSVPSPQVLSVELVEHRILADRDGWWNRIRDNDRETAINDMLARVRAEADQGPARAEARSRLEASLTPLVTSRGAKVRFEHAGLDGSAILSLP